MRCPGAYRSDNAGMSSEMRVKNPQAECQKISCPMLNMAGLVDPKMRAKAVIDRETC